MIDGAGGRLRTAEGWRALERGEVLAFPTGEQGAHQVANEEPDTLVFLAVSTAGSPRHLHLPGRRQARRLRARAERHGRLGVLRARGRGRLLEGRRAALLHRLTATRERYAQPTRTAPSYPLAYHESLRLETFTTSPVCGACTNWPPPM